MNKTPEWVRNPDGTLGFTKSLITGCLNHTKEGLCLGGMFPCFAYKLAHGRLKERYLANHNYPVYATAGMKIKLFTEPETDPFYPRFWPDRSEEIVYRKKPTGYFLNIMGEWAGDWVPEIWQEFMFDMIRACPQHLFYTLTKQPQNLIKFSPFLDNCRVGVTATNAEMLYDALAELRKVKAEIKYISFEPLLNRVNGGECGDTYRLGGLQDAGINWIIIGSQTKPYKPPKIEWVQEIVEAADEAGIPVFLKDNLKPLLIDEKGYPHAGVELLDRVIENGTWKLRQEIPE